MGSMILFCLLWRAQSGLGLIFVHYCRPCVAFGITLSAVAGPERLLYNFVYCGKHTLALYKFAYYSKHRLAVVWQVQIGLCLILPTMAGPD